MTDRFGSFSTPEEQELANKNAEFAILNSELAQRELDLATLRAELHVFEQHYIRSVGLKFAEIDRLGAEIAELLSARQPADHAARGRAHDARTRATDSATVAEAAPPLSEEDFRPSDDIKNLYREVAKRVHPDLAIDTPDRERRTRAMAAANVAYEQRDQDALQAILVEWQTSPDLIRGDGTGPDLVRMIRRIHQIKLRLRAIAAEIDALTQSELSVLQAEWLSANADGRNLLDDLAVELDNRASKLQIQLDELSAEQV